MQARSRTTDRPHRLAQLSRDVDLALDAVKDDDESRRIDVRPLEPQHALPIGCAVRARNDETVEGWVVRNGVEPRELRLHRCRVTA